jgi:hypothetical protein
MSAIPTRSVAIKFAPPSLVREFAQKIVINELEVELKIEFKTIGAEHVSCFESLEAKRAGLH